jgi:DNA-binding response OmpR family regulator
MPQQYKILLAEDDKFIARAYKDGLEQAGFMVTAVADGEEAMKSVAKEIPDIILLDLIMPIKNGFEVLADLKLDPKLKKVPVLVLSNLGQDSDFLKAKQLGAVDYMVKSNFSMKEVIAKVKMHLIK